MITKLHLCYILCGAALALFVLSPALLFIILPR